MKVDFISKDKIIVKVNDCYKKVKSNNLKEESKKILDLIVQNNNYSIYGTYDVEVYYVGNFIKIFVFNKKNNDDCFFNHIIVNIKKVKRNVFLTFNDFMLVKDYKNNKINSSDILKKDVIKLCEHYIIDTSIYNDYFL